MSEERSVPETPWWRTCNHGKDGLTNGDSGCLNGIWYDPCRHPECGGLCEPSSDCPCQGCDSPNCCRKAKP